MTSTTIAELRKVTVASGSSLLLDDIDWVVHAGEHWVVFGPNGAGKTTLLDVVATYRAPTAGAVTILGHELGQVDVRLLRTRIGYVGQRPSSMVRPRLRAVDVVVTSRHASFVAPRWHPYEAADWQRAEACLATMGVAHLADRPMATLSEGEQRRVLIARALMVGPEMLLLDEPYSGLDLRGREELVSSITSMARAPAAHSVVLVSHHVEDFPPAFDHIALMQKGRLVAAGPIEDVLTAEALSATFCMDLRLERIEGRWRAWHR